MGLVTRGVIFCFPYLFYIQLCPPFKGNPEKVKKLKALMDLPVTDVSDDSDDENEVVVGTEVR